jgi:hypothetical protein
METGVFNNYPTVTMVGEYELRHLEGLLYWPFAIVCPPEQRRDGYWNISEFSIHHGTIAWRDDDVQLDPYHMCLLYQAIEKHNRRT